MEQLAVRQMPLDRNEFFWSKEDVAIFDRPRVVLVTNPDKNSMISKGMLIGLCIDNTLTDLGVVCDIGGNLLVDWNNKGQMLDVSSLPKYQTIFLDDLDGRVKQECLKTANRFMR